MNGTREQTEGLGPRPLPRPAPTAPRDRLIELLIRKLLAGDPEFSEFSARTSLALSSGLVDYLFAVDDEPHEPEQVFERLRWGGQFIYISRDRRRLADMAQKFEHRGFRVLCPAGRLRYGGLGLPLLSRKLHYFIARKVLLIAPREISDRFTYHVQLVLPRTQRQDVVLKEVPRLERVVARLHQRFPELPMATLEKRARKFTEKIFPLFLTREAAMLKILERDLPPAYAHRVPRVIDMERDERGYVRRMRMAWLRNGGEPLSQLEFARQSADLLRVLHDEVGIIHLDLRLDNVVITPAGVGFVDFGSAVRVGEDLKQNPLLHTLFEELMRTSEIQRMLEQMTLSGAVTSRAIAGGCRKVDKAVDFFYLAVQINKPHSNPDFQGLVVYDPGSVEARAISKLTQEVLRPADPEHPPFRSARDMLIGIERLNHILARRGAAA